MKKRFTTMAVLATALIGATCLMAACESQGEEGGNKVDYSKYTYATFQQEMKFDAEEEKYPEGAWNVWFEKEISYQIECDYTKGSLSWGGFDTAASWGPTLINLYSDNSVSGWVVDAFQTGADGYWQDPTYKLVGIIFGYWEEADGKVTAHISCSSDSSYQTVNVDPAADFEFNVPYTSATLLQTMHTKTTVEYATLKAFYEAHPPVVPEIPDDYQ